MEMAKKLRYNSIAALLGIMLMACAMPHQAIGESTLATPTLSFTAIAAKTYGASPFTIRASSASTGKITYSVTSGPATISGPTATITGSEQTK